MKKGVFWKAYGIVVTCSLVLILAGLGVLWFYLDNYEKSRPEYKVDEIVEKLNKSDIDDLLTYLDIQVTEFENMDSVKEYLKSELSGEWSYTKNRNDSTDEEPCYILIKDGDKVGSISLNKEGKQGIFKMSNYSLASFNTELNKTRTVTIKAPNNAAVFVNGIALSDDYVSSNDEEVVDLEYVVDYIETPTYKSYKLDNIYGDLDVKVVGVSGNELSVEATETEDEKIVAYEYSFDCSEDFINSVDQRVRDYIYEYVDYVINTKQVSKVQSYTLSASNARKLFSNSAVAIAWNGTPKSIDYGEIETSNYQQYTEDCFSVEASVTASVVTNSGDVREYPTTLKIIWVKKSGSWYVVDFKLGR